ncbi:MAG TPA: fibronectin type III domain-containing protein, partial [Candidatus Thermoplasmatota archaeon]|nr:fibronectin type III domain-containing protein [Candidatus Thermoplasmatota archaeon]
RDHVPRDGGAAVTRYVIARSTDGVSWTTLNSNVLTTAYTDSSAASSTSYRYRVAAVNSAGQSAWSVVSNTATRLA